MKEKTLWTILAGIGFGLLEAIIILYMIQTGSYTLFDLPFITALIVATAFPYCIRFLKRFEINLANTGLIMTGLSFGICALYCLMIAKSINTTLSLVIYVFLIHLPELLILIFWKKRK